MASAAVEPATLDPPQPCAAQAAQPCKVDLSIAQVFALADRLAADGKIDEAIDLLKLVTHDENADYRAEARVRVARLLIMQGNLWDAANWYQQLLDEKPDAAAVRIEFAQLLARLGNETAARQQLQRAETSGLPDIVSQSIRRASDFLKNQKPVGFDLSIGLAPDSNINAATNSDTVHISGLPFTLSEDGQAQSGLGLAYSAQILLRQRLAPQKRWITQAGTSGNLYRERRFNDIALALDSGPEIATGTMTIRPAILLGSRFYRSGHLYNYYGGSLAALIPQGKQAQFSVSASLIQFDYARTYAYQTGRLASLKLGYDRVLTPRLLVHGGIGRTENSARSLASSLTSLTGEVALRRDFRHFSLFGQASLTATRAGGPDLMFAISRNDRTYEGGGGIIVRRISWHGLSPQVKAAYTRSESPIPLYSYRRLRGEISLTGSF